MASGVYKRNSNNNGWINYNDNNQIRIRNSANSGWLTPPSNGMIFRRNSANNGWEQIYPLGVISTTTTISVGTGGMGYKQEYYSNWGTGRSRQGFNTSSGGGGQQFGVIGAKASSITGSGAIYDSGTITYSGVLGASGNYNSTQTITFHGTTHATIGSGDPWNSHDFSGSMTVTWAAGGQNSAIPSTVVKVNGRADLTWMNNVGGFGNNLCMYNGEYQGAGGYNWSSNYLAITAFNMTLSNYKYSATSYSLERPASAARTFSMYSKAGVPKDDNYLKIVLPENFKFESTEQLIQLYESGEIEYISSNEYIPLQEINYKPIILSIDNNKVYTSPIFEECHLVQYLYEDKWVNSINSEPRYFLIREGATKVRLIDTKTDEVFYEIFI